MLPTLNINDGAISETGIEQIVLNHPGLVSLNVAHINVTSASVPALTRLTKLKESIVYATPLAGSRDVLDMRMTPAVVQLKKVLPNCDVSYAD